MKIKNMTSARGNKIANQFIITGVIIDLPHDRCQGDLFQSYNSNIAFKAFHCGNTGNTYQVFLDADTWDYSVTTGKYRNQFLNENIAATRAKIKSGEYKLINLN